MLTAKRDITYNYHSRHNPPQITVQPGQPFLAETELCTGGWLTSQEDVWTPDKTCALNPTVVIAVADAKPGDLLAVDILSITPDTLGYTGFVNASNPLACRILPRDWGLNVKTVRIDEHVVHWSDKIKLPVAPMIGTLGTAPGEETLSNAKGGVHGGNMDVQEVRAGSTVYLPVEVDGALLHVGDAHALQGDGEINCSGGIECRSVVKLRARLLKRPPEYRCVRIEDAAHIMTVGCERTPEESFHLAVEQMVLWMVDDYAFPIEEAYLLMGQVMEARCTQFVNPTSSYICKMPKGILQQANA